MNRPIQVVFVAALLGAAGPSFAGSSQEGWLYWTEPAEDVGCAIIEGAVMRSRLDGTDVQYLYLFPTSFVVNPRGLALEPSTGQMYWVESFGIVQGSLEGVAPMETVIDSLGCCGSGDGNIAFNPETDTVYWDGFSWDGVSVFPTIVKSNLDGSGYVEIMLESPGSSALAVDVAGGKLYWGLSSGDSCLSPTAKIQRSDLDGTGIEDVVTGLTYITALAVDHGSGKVYWSEKCDVNAIKRANLDGSGVEAVVSTSATSEFVGGIALNSRDGKIYWTEGVGGDWMTCSTGYGTIQRANLDGTDVQQVVDYEPITHPYGITLLLPPDGDPADLNDDGLVNGIDLALLLGAWGACPPRGECAADLNGDGVVNGHDLAILLGAWR